MKENSLEAKKYLLVEAAVLPEVFLRVMKAKELLAGGEARNVSQAAQMAGVSRSAFYKYRDSVFHGDLAREATTLIVTLLDETGSLQALLAAISQAGASVATINQSVPENGAADVAVTVRTDGLRMSLDELMDVLLTQKTVVKVRRSK